MIQDRICRECGADFKGGPRAYYCPSCRIERRKQNAREFRRRKRSGEVRPLGSKDKCERCGAEYTVQAGAQRFCPECQPIHAAEYDRVTSLEFYNQHKDRINPPRKLKRRKRSNICVWCGNEFEPVNGSTTCSDECRRQDINRYHREREKRIRAEYARPEGSYTIPEIAQKLGKARQTILKWYNAGKLPEPDGYEKRGNPYWLPSKISSITAPKKKCAWCEKEFEPKKGQTLCSEECKKLYRNKYMRERYERKSGSPEAQTNNTASPARLDLTGERYGMLTVVSETSRVGKHRRYICRCDCGNEVPVKVDSLRSGNTKSCGCLKSKTPPPKFKDLTGKRYGRLVVIERSYEKARNNHSFWLCKCDCGNTRIADSADLHNGVTTNCGRRCPLGKRPIINPERHLKQQKYREEYNRKKKKDPAST